MFQKITSKKTKKIKHGGFKSLVRRAIELGVCVEFSKEEPALAKFEYKGQVCYCRMNVVPVLKMMGDFTKNKNITKKILNDSRIKVPKGIKASSMRVAIKGRKINKMLFPLIAKPLDGSLGRGTVWNILGDKGLAKAVKIIRAIQKKHGYSKYFLLEEMKKGEEYRALVYKNKIVSCVKKMPAGVVGDGKSTISELIKKFNKKRGKGFEIKKDRIFWKNLKDKKISLELVLPECHLMKFRDNLNMSDGGRAVDCTKKMHLYFQKICKKAIRLSGLTYGGVDLITHDISKKSDNYAILEVNPNPYYNMHEKPLVEGKGIDFSKMILKDIFKMASSRKEKKIIQRTYKYNQKL